MSMIEDTRKALDAASVAYNRLIGRTRRVRVSTPDAVVGERLALPEPGQGDEGGGSGHEPDTGTPARPAEGP